MTPEPMTLDDARAIAREAHRGQVDKLGVDYMEHVEAVAAGLADLDLELQIAGMLHDVVEDSDITLHELRARGVPERSLVAIELVTRTLHPELDYDEAIRLATTSPDATLVKISDNAHNSRPDRVQALELQTGEPANPRYARAREILYAAAPITAVVTILKRVCPPLLRELPGEDVTVTSLEELFAIFEVTNLQDLADVCGENYDPDVYPGPNPDEPELIVGTYGTGLEFPMTLADLWEMLDHAEEWYAEGLEDELPD
jgi:hypothetical protein